MKNPIASKKLELAVDILHTGAGGIKERLWYAFLFFNGLTLEDFPQNLKKQYEFIISTLTTEDATNNLIGQPIERIQNTLEKMDIQNCIYIAEKIVNLNTDLKLYTILHQN